MWCGSGPGGLSRGLLCAGAIAFAAGNGEGAPAPAESAARSDLPPPRTAPPPAGVPPAGQAVGGDFLDEGFEGAFPPAGWTQTGNPAVSGTHRWHRSGAAPYVRTGTGAALVQWQSTYIQDEKLGTHALDLSTATPTGLRLAFWWYGNPFWAANADFQVHASSDEVVWTELWKMADLTETGWAWRQTIVDVGSYAGGSLFVRFRYKGRDGADLAVDDVRVGYLAPPAPPPNDDCLSALNAGYVIGPQAGTFLLTGDNTWATPDYPLAAAGSCTGFSHTGKDVVWVVDLPGQHHFTATMTTTGGWDDTLFLVTDCADPQGTCVVGDNGLPDSSRVVWVNFGTETARGYLVASGYAEGAGEFTLSGIIHSGTALSGETWGRIKARYR